MVLVTLGVLIASFAFISYFTYSKRWLASQKAPGPPTVIKTGGKGDSGKEIRSLPPTNKNSPSFKSSLVASDLKSGNDSSPIFGMESEEEGSTTPKAAAAATPVFEVPSMAVPELSLSNSNSLTSTGEQTAVIKTSPAAPTKASASALMPPPSVRPSALRPLPKTSTSTTSSLAPPPSAASALRVPPGRASSNSPSTTSSFTSASTSTLPPTSRPRKKIILPPGHSPLDWAHLTKNPPSASFLRGEGVPPRVLKVSPTQLKYYHGRKGRDAWGTYQGKVYNMTPYKDFHPGGVGELMRGAGKAGIAEKLFNEIHPWVNWDGMLSECLVGVLVGEGEGEGEREGAVAEMDEMD